MRGTATLKRMVAWQGRPAAEFDYRGTGEGYYAMSAVRMSLTGECWVDLATGFMLELKTTAPGQFTQAGEPVQMEIKEERTLVRSRSRGF